MNPDVGVLELGSMRDAVFQFVITLDPLSEMAQKWSSLLIVAPCHDAADLRSSAKCPEYIYEFT